MKINQGCDYNFFLEGCTYCTKYIADVAWVGNGPGSGCQVCSHCRVDGIHVVTWHACGWGRRGRGAGSYRFGGWLRAGWGADVTPE